MNLSRNYNYDVSAPLPSALSLSSDCFSLVLEIYRFFDLVIEAQPFKHRVYFVNRKQIPLLVSSIFSYSEESKDLAGIASSHLPPSFIFDRKIISLIASPLSSFSSFLAPKKTFFNGSRTPELYSYLLKNPQTILAYLINRRSLSSISLTSNNSIDISDVSNCLASILRNSFLAPSTSFCNYISNVLIRSCLTFFEFDHILHQDRAVTLVSSQQWKLDFEHLEAIFKHLYPSVVVKTLSHANAHLVIPNNPFSKLKHSSILCRNHCVESSIYLQYKSLYSNLDIYRYQPDSSIPKPNTFTKSIYIKSKPHYSRPKFTSRSIVLLPFPLNNNIYASPFHMNHGYQMKILLKLCSLLHNIDAHLYIKPHPLTSPLQIQYFNTSLPSRFELLDRKIPLESFASHQTVFVSTYTETSCMDTLSDTRSLLRFSLSVFQ